MMKKISKKQHRCYLLRTLFSRTFSLYIATDYCVLIWDTPIVCCDILATIIHFCLHSSNCLYCCRHFIFLIKWLFTLFSSPVCLFFSSLVSVLSSAKQTLLFQFALTKFSSAMFARCSTQLLYQRFLSRSRSLERVFEQSHRILLFSMCFTINLCFNPFILVK